MFENPVLLIFPAALAYAAVMDFFTMTIPNRISLALIVGFFVAVPFSGLSMYEILMHVAAGALMLAIGVGMFSFRLLGGGDAKLLAACSLWVGMESLLPFILLVAVKGGILAMMILAYRRIPMAALPDKEWAMRLHQRGGGIPYGLAIAAGGFMIYPHTEIFKSFLF